MYIGPVEDKLCNQKGHVEETLVPGRKNSLMMIRLIVEVDLC